MNNDLSQNSNRQKWLWWCIAIRDQFPFECECVSRPLDL